MSENIYIKCPVCGHDVEILTFAMYVVGTIAGLTKETMIRGDQTK